ncbi:DUF805 domain-containing protein [Aurantimonas marina]|uniref:DUF805 domain-containing protein n=1 Tax=Aurantimonas marina TaxID=2780508 RepID=UPI0019D2FFBD|nr:DUF805 domain-containing protein [Aurantimonas marina]
MGFSEAVRSVFSNYANFRGRASRPEFWWFALFALIAQFMLGLLDSIVVGPILGLSPLSGHGARPLGALFSLAIFVPSLAVGARRLHDTGRSAGWMLIWLIPMIGWLIFFFLAARPTEPVTNQYGPPPLRQPDPYR